MAPIRRRPHLFALLAFAAMIALTWLAATPFSWDNDEAGHYWTARDIYADGGLPDQDAFPGVILPDPPFRESGLYRYHALPPTYYVSAAVLFNLMPGQVGDYVPGLLAGRLLSAAFFVLTVGFVYEFVRRLNGDRRPAAALTAAACALIPKMASLGGSMTADSFALAVVAFVALATVRVVQSTWSWRATITLGAAAALVLMSRPSALPILILPAVMFLFHLRHGIGAWLRRGLLLAAIAVLPNAWWLIRNWRNLDGDLLGATTHLEYLDLRGLPYQTNEVYLFKALETGFSGLHEMLLQSDWLLRFNTRVWLSERYNDGSGLGILLALVLLVLVVTAVSVAVRRQQTPGVAALPLPQRFIPLILLAAFLIAAGLAAFNSYNDGIFVVGRFALPPLALFIAATTAAVSRSDGPLGRYAAPALAGLMLVVHAAFWAGFLLPDLLRQVGPAL